MLLAARATAGCYNSSVDKTGLFSHASCSPEAVQQRIGSGSLRPAELLPAAKANGIDPQQDNHTASRSTTQFSQQSKPHVQTNLRSCYSSSSRFGAPEAARAPAEQLCSQHGALLRSCKTALPQKAKKTALMSRSGLLGFRF